MNPNWTELPAELLQEIAQRHGNYVDYIRTRSACKSWRAAIPKTPDTDAPLPRLPFLLLPYHERTTSDERNTRGLYNIPDAKTYCLELPEAFDKRCCGSSHGWLVMVEDSSSMFLLNPLKRATIYLPLLSTLPTFPTHVVFKNSRNMDEEFIRKEKAHIRDTFVVKALVSADPSLVADFMVVIIYGFHGNLAFCRQGDASWTTIGNDVPISSPHYNDAMFKAGTLYAVDQLGRISALNHIPNTSSTRCSMFRVAAPPELSPRDGYKQWYLSNSDEEDLLLVARFRKVVDKYEYRTKRFEIYRLDCEHEEKSKWLKLENLGDKTLFLGWNSSLCISTIKNKSSAIKGNCIYYTDDHMRVCRDYVWEGHDFGIFELEDKSVHSLSDLASYPSKQPRFPNIFFYERSLWRDTSLFVLPPPIWVSISP